MLLTLNQLQRHIRDLEIKYHRPPNSVRCLAVSKQQPLDAIEALYHQGQHAFGENYLQEALTKIEALSHLSLEWHFIGHIQRNKTRKIATQFQWVHSVDSELIAARLNEARPTHLPPLNICLEVNVDGEQSKSGVAPHELLTLATACAQHPRLKLRGLMTLPEATNTLDEQRRAFKTVAALFRTLNSQGFHLDTLSMGMSNDYEAAIAEGSTMIRLGRALFGERKNTP